MLHLFQTILLLGSIQGLILASILLKYGKRRTVNSYLTFLIITISVQTILVGYGDNKLFKLYPHLSMISRVIPFFFAPLLYLYVKKVVSAKTQKTFDDLLHFLPALVYFLYLLVCFILTAHINRKIPMYNEFVAEPIYFDELKLLQALIYYFLCLKKLKKFKTMVRNHSSANEYRSLKWLDQLMYYFIFLLVVALLLINLNREPLRFQNDPIVYFYLLTSIGIYCIAYIVLRNPRVLGIGPRYNTDWLLNESLLYQGQVNSGHETPQAEQGHSSVKYANSSLSNQISEVYLQQLILCMEQEKPYLKNSLTLQDLSSLSNIPHHFLSQIINENLSKNFYDFVNSYRVEEAKRLLLSEAFENYTIISIGFEAGFNSKTTFYTVFKKVTGYTPSEFAKKYR